MKAVIHVGLKPGVLDPQGRAIARSLNNLGFDEVTGAKQGRVIELDLKETRAALAESRVREMCEQLLANTVIESYRIRIEA
ncbi:MAG: phosphoribosylformylglycinamidine synthase subunit PurS [Hyphomonadaceae bacterium]|nr:phosphoribosylformylglycinamidine synthase subunit PurS [Hyphomonadaceae bacterium]MBC6412087.1 phosphoribosylformylglycinamidine synthase subunit PurS [Hyphomonadaceae bacterium]